MLCAGNAAVIQGNAQLTSGSIVGGNTVVCGAATSDSSSTFHLVKSCNAFDFTATTGFINSFSDYHGFKAPSAPYSCSGGSCTLTGTSGSPTNIFYLPSATFGSITSTLTINSAAGTFVVINVDGPTNSMIGFSIALMGGIDNQHVFYNFYQTTGLTISGKIAVKVRPLPMAVPLCVLTSRLYMIVQGTVVAPSATVTLNDCTIDGSLFAGSVSGYGEIGMRASLR